VTNPRSEYERRLAGWRRRLDELDRRHLLLSNVRIALAVAGAVLLWQAFVRASIPAWWPVADWLLFGGIAVHHARVLNGRDRARRAAALYERGIDRLNDRWPGRGRGGADFGEGHPYARDLDLFGRASLFELLNTARTEAGEATLADWLRGPAPADEVRARQAAVAELRPRVDFREDVAVLAAESPVGRTGPLAAWALSPPVGFPAPLAPACLASAIVTVALAALAYERVVERVWPMLWILVATTAAALWRKQVHHVLHSIETPERDLGLLAELLARIEREPFDAPRLVAVREALAVRGVAASRSIARLRAIVSWGDATHNLLFGPIAYVLLIRQQLAIAIDRWHRDHGPAIAGWLRAVGDAEALSAFATYAFEHPGDPFPAIVEAPPHFDARGLAHPLLPTLVAVRNDVRLGGDARAIVVSGSNMSGKSTLLRAVGVNVVLAMSGAPVRAEALGLSPLVLGATLRIDDSLEAGHSRFYSEILRLRGIVDAARGPVPLLFLLDEILHGTNSHDRRIGAEGVVRALLRLGAIGLVTTHDLALTELAEQLDGVLNVHFADHVEDGRMVFDYRMRPGVVEHSNALALMRAIGLEV